MNLKFGRPYSDHRHESVLINTCCSKILMTSKVVPTTKRIEIRDSQRTSFEIMRDPIFDGRVKDLGGEVGFDYQPLNSSIHRNRCTTCCGSSASSAISSRYPRIKPASHPDIFKRLKAILLGFKGVQWTDKL